MLTSGIQIRLTKPFARDILAEAGFAGGRIRGCLKLRQIIKAILDHRNARTPSGRCSQGLVRRNEAAPIATCDGGKVGPYGFRQGAPVARSPYRKQIRPEDEGSAPALREQISWSGHPGLGSKRFRKARNGKRNHGKVRKTPRRFGCGRHRHDAPPRPCSASGGRNFRHPNRRAAAEFFPGAAVGGCRREKI